MIFSTLNTPSGFYVYVYLRKDGTPYYVGKGNGRRAWMSHRYRNKGIHTPPNNRIQIIAHGLLEMESNILEKRLILKFGRKDQKTGILHNRTDGGEGVSGLVRSESQKQHSKRFGQLAKERNNKLAVENKHPFQNSQWHKSKEKSEVSKTTAKKLKYENRLGFQQGHAASAGKIGGKIGGSISGKLAKNTVNVIFKDGSGKRISQSFYAEYKEKALQQQIPLSNWEFVAVRSSEAKRRKLNCR